MNQKRTLELGAASALPSIIASLNGAYAFATDYPDPNVIANIVRNGEINLCPTNFFEAKGLIWGDDTSELIREGKFDYIFMADLIFNHSEHKSMLKSCKECLSETGTVLVTFSHHVTKYVDRNMVAINV